MATIKILDFTFDVDFNTNTASISKFEGTDSVLYLPNTLTLKNPEGNIVEVLLTGIGAESFANNIYLKNIIFRKDNKYSYIDTSAFTECYNLNNIVLGNNISEINSFAFSNCTGLTNITIPSSVTKIDEFAFMNCTNLTKVNITNMVDWCNIEFIGWDSNPLQYANNLYLNGKLVETLEIPDVITTIKLYTFINCLSLKEVNLNQVTTVMEQAFFGCTNLEKVNFNDNIQTIHWWSFYDCRIKDLKLSNSNYNIKIYSEAFSNNGYLNSVNLDNIEYLGSSIFSGCNIDELVINTSNLNNEHENYNDFLSGCNHINTLEIDGESFLIQQYYIGISVDKVDVLNIKLSDYTSYWGEWYGVKTLKLPKTIRHIDLLGNPKNLYIDTTELNYNNILTFGTDGMDYSPSNDKQIDVYITSLSGWNYIQSFKEDYPTEYSITNPLAAGGKLYYLKNEKYELLQDLNLEFRDIDEPFNSNTLPYCGYKYLRTVRLSGDISLPRYYFNDCSNLETVAIKKLGDSNVKLTEYVFSDTNIKTVFYGDNGDDWLNYFFYNIDGYYSNGNNGNLPYGKEVNGKIDLTDLSELGVVFTTYCFPQLSTLFSQPIINLTPATNYQIVLENNQGILSFHKFKTQLLPTYAKDKDSDTYKKGLVWVRTSYKDEEDGQIKYKYVQGIPWYRKDGGKYEIIESAEQIFD